MNRLDFNSLNRLLANFSVSCYTQGRYYLSAETLIDMKNWVSRIRTAIRNINRKKDGKLVQVPGESGPSSIGASKMDSSNEPEYASIKDYPRYSESCQSKML